MISSSTTFYSPLSKFLQIKLGMSNFHDKNVALDKMKKISANTCVINSKGDFDEIWSKCSIF